MTLLFLILFELLELEILEPEFDPELDEELLELDEEPEPGYFRSGHDEQFRSSRGLDLLRDISSKDLRKALTRLMISEN